MSSSSSSSTFVNLEAPSAVDQAKEIAGLDVDETDLVIGDVHYAVSETWYRRWDGFSSGASTAHPGPIDNNDIANKDFPIALKQEAVRGW